MVTPYNLIGTVDVTVTNTIVQTATCDCTDTSLDISASTSHRSSTNTIATTSSSTLPVAYTASITAIGSPATIAYDSANSFSGSNARTTSAALPSRSAITYPSSPNVNSGYPPLPAPRPYSPSGNAATTGSDGYAISLMTVTVALPSPAFSSDQVETLLVITSPSPSKRFSTKPQSTLPTLTMNVMPVVCLSSIQSNFVP